MKLRDKIVVSILFGLCAMLLYRAPMWWGVLFSSLAEDLTTAGASADAGGWFRVELGGAVLRLKSLDALFALLH